MRNAVLSLVVFAGVVLVPMGCRERSTPPPPRLVGASDPVTGVEAPEDQLGIGGSGAADEEAFSTEPTPGSKDEARPVSPFSSGEPPEGRSTIP